MHKPTLQLLIDNWEILKDEALAINESYPEVGRPKAALARLDPVIYSNVVTCKGWSVIQDTRELWWNFPLIAWGEPTEAALQMAPESVKLLQKVGGGHFCGFSVLLPGGIIAPHHDLPACDEPHGSLTYHMGLVCPPHNYLIQEGIAHEEKDGKLLIFTGPKTHSAINMSNERRIILYAVFNS
jgi:aspartyl/asparaginyl beta-hydroxylase (cupin superfamily)